MDCSSILKKNFTTHDSRLTTHDSRLTTHGSRLTAHFYRSSLNTCNTGLRTDPPNSFDLSSDHPYLLSGILRLSLNGISIVKARHPNRCAIWFVQIVIFAAPGFSRGYLYVSWKSGHVSIQ